MAERRAAAAAAAEAASKPAPTPRPQNRSSANHRSLAPNRLLKGRIPVATTIRTRFEAPARGNNPPGGMNRGGRGPWNRGFKGRAGHQGRY